MPSSLSVFSSTWRPNHAVLFLHIIRHAFILPFYVRRIGDSLYYYSSSSLEYIIIIDHVTVENVASYCMV